MDKEKALEIVNNQTDKAEEAAYVRGFVQGVIMTIMLALAWAIFGG